MQAHYIPPVSILQAFAIMVQLRPYQIKFVNDLRQKLAEKKRIIACAATGAGKTKVFLSITETAIQRGWTVLVVTESLKIYKQIIDERPCEKIESTVKHLEIKPATMYTAMAQTLTRRPFIIAQLQVNQSKLLIINDEAHIGTSTKLLEQLPDSYLLGFTATPDYKVAPHLSKIYKDIVIGPQPLELVKQGFLSNYKHFERQKADLSNLKTKNGEFTEESQFEVFDSTVVFEGLLEDLGKFTYNKCLIFCSSIAHANSLALKLEALNYEISTVHSQIPDADSQLENFMKGSVKICVSVGILTKGFDFPAIDLIILNRATTSLALYCQMIGRGSRITDGKNNFKVLDYGGNATRHNLWDFEHPWGELWNKKKKKTNKVAPVRKCPVCEYVMPLNTNICPECGHVMEKKQKQKEHGELVDVTEKYKDNIKGRKISSLTPYELSIYAKKYNKKAMAIRVAKAKSLLVGSYFLDEFAKFMGYKPGWVFMQYQDMPTEIPYFDITIK